MTIEALVASQREFRMVELAAETQRALSRLCRVDPPVPLEVSSSLLVKFGTTASSDDVGPIPEGCTCWHRCAIRVLASELAGAVIAYGGESLDQDMGRCIRLLPRTREPGAYAVWVAATVAAATLGNGVIIDESMVLQRGKRTHHASGLVPYLEGPPSRTLDGAVRRLLARTMLSVE